MVPKLLILYGTKTISFLSPYRGVPLSKTTCTFTNLTQAGTCGVALVFFYLLADWYKAKWTKYTSMIFKPLQVHSNRLPFKPRLWLCGQFADVAFVLFVSLWAWTQYWCSFSTEQPKASLKQFMLRLRYVNWYADSLKFSLSWLVLCHYCVQDGTIDERVTFLSWFYDDCLGAWFPDGDKAGVQLTFTLTKIVVWFCVCYGLYRANYFWKI